MDQSLESLGVLVSELKKTTSSKEKISILKNHPTCMTMLRYTYDRFFQYGVTSAGCRSISEHAITGKELGVIELLDELRKRNLTGNAAKIACLSVARSSGMESLFWDVIDRDLKCGIDEASISKAFPGLLPEFKVALAKNYQNHIDSVTFNGLYFMSRKLDGVRVICIIRGMRDIHFFSREGHEFTSLGVLREHLAEMPHLSGQILDGELCIEKEDGAEDFKDAVSQIKRKNFTIAKPRYHLFDTLSIADFASGRSSLLLSDRLRALRSWIPAKHPCLSVLPQKVLTSPEQLAKEIAKANSNGWEGLMLRKDAKYVGKRTSDLLKIKKFHDAEYKVEDVVMGTKKMLVKGRVEEVECLAAAVIHHKGNKVRVGSGWSDEERVNFHADPASLIGRVITVSYFEESKDADGKISLRFPTVKCIHGSVRDI